MSVHPLIAKAEQSSLQEEKPKFEIGDTVEVGVRIFEGEKERVQLFTGIVIAMRGGGTSEMFTVRRIVNGEGVERVFPVHSPGIAGVNVVRRAVVRRAKLYYLRDRIGTKAFTLKERIVVDKESKGRSRSRIKARKQKAETAPTGETKAPKKPKRRIKKKETSE